MFGGLWKSNPFAEKSKIFSFRNFRVNSEFFQSVDEIRVDFFAGSVRAGGTSYDNKIVIIVDIRYQQPKPLADTAIYAASHDAVTYFFTDDDTYFDIMSGNFIHT